MKKKVVSIVLCAAMLTTLVVGCGSSSSTSTDSSSADSGSASGESSADLISSGNATGNPDDFDWKAYSGTTLEVQFNEHTYANAVVEKLDDFTELTGIEVNYTITPESNYFDKLNTSLSSRSGTPDVYMTGAYQLWEYAPAGYVEPLEDYINNQSLTASDYDFDDFYPAVTGALQWDLTAGHAVGSGSQWALPMGYELNEVAYNKNALSDEQVEAIKTTDGLLETSKELEGWNGSGSYGIAIRGSRNWGTIHAGYMTLFGTWGGTDFAIEDGSLVCKLNEQEAVDMTDYWVQLAKTSTNQWSTYTWSEASSDLGAGKAAMLFDATSAAYFQNFEGASDQSGNIAWAGVPLPEGKDTQLSNVWVWSLAMNADSQNKEAAWYFIQYFTSKDFMQWSGTEGSCVDAPRQSVATSDEYKAVLEDATNYANTFDELIGNATILFTPQPYFFETTTTWASYLQDLVTSDTYSSTQEAMDALTDELNMTVSDIVVE